MSHNRAPSAESHASEDSLREQFMRTLLALATAVLTYGSERLLAPIQAFISTTFMNQLTSNELDPSELAVDAFTASHEPALLLALCVAGFALLHKDALNADLAAGGEEFIEPCINKLMLLATALNVLLPDDSDQRLTFGL